MSDKQRQCYLMPRPPEAHEIRSGVDRYLYFLSHSSTVRYTALDDFVTYPKKKKVNEATGPTVTESKEIPRSTAKGKASFPRPKWLALALAYFHKIRKLRASLARIPDRRTALIHVNHIGCEFETIAARLAGFRKIIATVHNLPGEDATAQHWVRRLIERLSFYCADHCICVSESTYEAWHQRLGLNRSKTTTIFNGMFPPDLSRFQRERYRSSLLPGRSDYLWIGICARLHPMKGHEVLMRAFELLCKRFPKSEICLLIAGDGPLRDTLSSLANKLNIADQVHFLGFRPDAQEFAAALDINVLPSVFSETLGYSLIEAMFAGRPSVVSDVGGMKELITASGGGLVVPRRDVQALAEALETYLRALELRLEHGRAAANYAHANLTAQAMNDATMKVYEQV